MRRHGVPCERSLSIFDGTRSFIHLRSTHDSSPESRPEKVAAVRIASPVERPQRRKMEGNGGRMSRGMLPLLGLHVANEYYRLERKPPVTAGLLLANTLIYLRPGVLNSLLPTIDEVFFNPHLVLKNRDFKRLFLSAFYHMGESHLVYNMLSLLWKGIQLETSMGSIEFAAMVAELLAMSQGITLLLAKSLLLFDYEKAYYREFSVGFSGVLIAMKVVLNSQTDEYTVVHGLIVPSRYAAWAELILVQLFVPGVSFLGHLGGILAGLLYLQLLRSYPGSSPLSTVIRGFKEIVRWPVRFVKNLFQVRTRRVSGRGGGRVGRNGHGGEWRCAACTYNNSASFSACEMCGTMRNNERISSNQRTVQTRNPSLEELRQRRIERFTR